MNKPQTPAIEGQGQNLDPLEELARIMNDSNEGDREAPADPANANLPAVQGSKTYDPLDLGLGDQGLAELFGGPATPQGEPGAQPAELPADDILQGLDFSNEDPAALAVESLPAQANPNPPALPPAPTVAPTQPMLSDHLTPRPDPVLAPPASEMDDIDLLAAMDELALSEPQASVQAQPTQASMMSAHEADFGATPSSHTAAEEWDLVSEEPSIAGQEFEQAALDEPQGKGGPNRLVLVALGALALVGVLSVLAFGLIGRDSGSDGAPQLIAAQDSEDKIEPINVVEDTETQPGDAVFSELDQDGQAATQAPRVILPQPGSGTLPLTDNQRLPSVDIAPAPPGSTASRTVRTVTVRADGTVVESTVEPTVETPDVQATAPSARPVEVVSVNTAPVVETVNDAAQDLAAATRAAAQAALAEANRAVSSALPPPPVARPSGIQTTTVRPVQTQPVQTQPVVTTPVATQAPAPAQQSAPVQLAAPQAAPAQTVAPVETAAVSPSVPSSVGSGDFIVQLASLRTDQEARDTFNRLQGQFGSILGGFGPNIQRADLGSRGIFHRVRIGPMDRASADSVCQRYQAAGGDCFVQRQ